jgi:hypothetical protein
LQPLPERAFHPTWGVRQTRKDGVRRAATELHVDTRTTSSLFDESVTMHGPDAHAIIGEEECRRADVSTAGIATAGANTAVAVVSNDGTTSVTSTAGASHPTAGGSTDSSNNAAGMKNDEDKLGESHGTKAFIHFKLPLF